MRFSKRLELVWDIVALGVFFLSWLVQVWNYKRLEKLLAHQVHLPQKKNHYSEPSKQFYYSESRLLMDYPFEKMIGGMVLKMTGFFNKTLCDFVVIFLRNRFAFQLGSCWWCSGVVVVGGAWQLQLRELVWEIWDSRGTNFLLIRTIKSIAGFWIILPKLFINQNHHTNRDPTLYISYCCFSTCFSLLCECWDGFVHVVVLVNVWTNIQAATATNQPKTLIY